MPPLKKADLREFLDSRIMQARKKVKRSRSLRTRATQEGRIAALQEAREEFLDGPLPTDAE